MIASPTQQVKPQVGQRVEIARIGRTQRVKIGELGGLIRGGRIDGRERELIGEGNKQNTAYSAVKIAEGCIAVGSARIVDGERCWAVPEPFIPASAP